MGSRHSVYMYLYHCRVTKRRLTLRLTLFLPVRQYTPLIILHGAVGSRFTLKREELHSHGGIDVTSGTFRGPI